MKKHFHILYHALYNSADKWRDIGLFLKLDPGKLNVIEADKTGVHARLEEMLSLWLNQADPSPTKSEIVQVLKLHLNEQAKTLQKVLL